VRADRAHRRRARRRFRRREFAHPPRCVEIGDVAPGEVRSAPDSAAARAKARATDEPAPSTSQSDDRSPPAFPDLKAASQIGIHASLRVISGRIARNSGKRGYMAAKAEADIRASLAAIDAPTIIRTTRSRRTNRLIYAGSGGKSRAKGVAAAAEREHTRPLWPMVFSTARTRRRASRHSLQQSTQGCRLADSGNRHWNW